MEDKNRFNELEQGLNKRLNEVVEEEQKSSGFKKILLIVAIALIILVVVVVVFYKSTREPAKSASLPPDKNMQKIGNARDFESLTLEPAVKKPEEDRFDKIVKDIQSKQNQPPLDTQNNPENKQLNALPVSPLDKTRAPKDIPAEPAPTPPQHQAHKAEHPIHQETHQEAHKAEHKERKQAHKEAHEKSAKTHQEAHKAEHKVAPHAAHKTEHREAPKPHTAHKAEHPAPSAKAKHPAKAGLPKGFYLQVGVFSKTPNPKFLEAIKAYPHKVQDFHGQKRYLIGPFESQEKANEELEKVSQDVAKPVHVQIK
ncbi:SPOR domain-containing protein [Helicobacter ailurogastricus]|uniref:SPOR domain-containing protein n=1 Tax=Helicobacter ailurogastricus TaxID=1578720 RepID=UPI0022C92A65|nr:SPOR domain-containing protein [Helicobacter ailurogastricus]GLH57538.1 Cell division protein ZipA [Helicobacter ailurogastricus]GLH59680.1 Cell division protein ZipA [Helicobacter ailurogastricus]